MKSKYFLKSTIWIVLLSLFTNSLFAQIKGNGNVVRQARDVGAFTGVVIKSGIDLFIKQASQTSVEIKTDENIQQYIITKVEDGILNVYVEKNRKIWKTNAMDAFVTVKDINSVKVSGGGDVEGQGIIKSDDLKIGISGGGDLELTLDAGATDIGLSGGGDAEIKGAIKKFKAVLSGGGDLELDARLEKIELTLSGGGDAKISGGQDISEAVINISGGGDLETDMACKDIKIQTSGGGDAEINAGNNVEMAKVSISGGGDLNLVLQSKELYLMVGSGSDAWLKGVTDKFSAVIKGGGDLDASHFKVQSAKLKLADGSGARVYVSGDLSADASGGGQIYVSGNPQINANLSGGSRIHKK